MPRKAVLFIAACLLASGQDIAAEKQAVLGRMIAANVRRDLKVLDSPKALDYVRRLVAELSQRLPERLPPLKIELVADPDSSGRVHEPIVLPGGYMFIRASLFLRARDQAEFTSMLAHALGHIAKRHGVNAMSPRSTNTASIPLIYADWSSSPMMPAGLLNVARANEIEADTLAVSIMSVAGYDPGALGRYIERVQPNRPEYQKFSPLPPLEERLAAIRGAVGELRPQDSYNIDSTDFSAARHEILPLLPDYAPGGAKAPTLRRLGEPIR
jgi:predicted Zn-dependent protease